MPGLVTEAAAARLRALLAQSRTAQPRPSRLPVPGRRFVIAKCTDDTAIGGADPIGAECYPAVVMGMAGDEVLADQEELGEVWLTVISSGAPTTPTVDQWYEGMFSGTFDPDPTGTSDERPRVFATPGGGSLSLAEHDSTTGFNLMGTADGTFTSIGVEVTVDAGVYLIMWQLSGYAEVSAFGVSKRASVWGWLFKEDSGGETGISDLLGMACTAGLNYTAEGNMSSWYLADISESTTFRIKAARVGGGTATWVSAGSNPYSVIEALKVG